MAKGENIFKRKDGRWEARYPKGYDLTGKLRYGFCYGRTYREAKEKAQRARAALAAGEVPSGKAAGRKFASYCGEWLDAARERVKPATYVKYQSVLKNHILPLLGDCCPGAITTETVKRFSEHLLREEHLAPKTVRDILTLLRSLLRYTARQLPQMETAEIVYPKENAGEIRVLSLQEQRRLTRYLLAEPDECKLGVLLALLTGLRIGEVCALRWGDIDPGEKTLRVHATMQRLPSDAGSGRTQVFIASPKSGKSVRTIPMTEQAAALCGRMRRADAAFVLTGTERYMEPRALQYRLKRYTEDCGLEGVHFHTLRHTFATRCVEVGFEIKTLSEILGHSSTTVTLNRYVHSSLELKRSNMEKLKAVGM